MRKLNLSGLKKYTIMLILLVLMGLFWFNQSIFFYLEKFNQHCYPEHILHHRRGRAFFRDDRWWD